MKLSKLFTLISIIIWILIWFIAAFFIDNEILLPSPLTVMTTLFDLIKSKDFYISILFSLRGIAIGFTIGLISGIILASLSYINIFAKSFINIFIKCIKSIPVASFVILVLFWISGSHLSILISALIVMPVIYTNVLSGLTNTDIKLLEFAKVFRLSTFKKIHYIYIPAIMQPLISACTVTIGYAWKSGIATEIIGLINNSIGNELYKTKLYLETPKLFAWTIVIILISFICEKLIVLMLNLLNRKLGGLSNVNSN